MNTRTEVMAVSSIQDPTRRTAPSPDAGYIVILHFEVGSRDEQQKFLEAYAPVIERWVSDWPGFVSATLHRSTDGTRVVNYTQWAGEEEYRHFLEHSDPELRMRAIEEAFSVVPDIQGPDMTRTHTYELDRIMLPKPKSDSVARD